MSDKGWSRTFDDPIPLPSGGELLTLRDAANYITKLPKRQHDTFAWRAAIEALMLVAERGGDTMLPRIGIMRALHPDEPVPTSHRKTAKKYRIEAYWGATIAFWRDVGPCAFLYGKLSDPISVIATVGKQH